MSTGISDSERVVRKSPSDFSCSKTLGTFINNKDFAKGYVDFLNGKDNQATFIWQVLSAIGDDVGETIYSNVLNYIDDVSNIDLCKIKALRSIIDSLGVNYSVLNNIDMMPLEIANVMDIMSINKKYLLDSKRINNNLINELYNKTYVEGVGISALSDDLSGAYQDGSISSQGYIDDDKYSAFLSSIYSDIISSYISMPYGDKEERPDITTIDISQPIYVTYGKNIDAQFQQQAIDVDEAYQFKVRNNIDSSFNESDVVDMIDSGTISINDFTGAYLELINMEIKKRQAPKYPDFKTSRYAYYKEQKVNEYFTFLKTKFYASHESVLPKPYDIDTNYFEISQDDSIRMLTYDGDENNGTYRLTDKESAQGEYVSFEEVFEDVVGQLVDTTIYISKLRENLKLQIQKNRMKGTFNYLSYMINEYLVGFSDSLTGKDNENTRKALKNHVRSDVNIHEYYDTTEYFNLSTDNTQKARNSSEVNERYWETDEEQGSSESGYAFAKDEIENFYMETMNLKNKTSDLMNFLSTVYESGANSSYVSKDTGKEVIVTKDALSSDSKDVFEKFYGEDDYGTTPYLNIKNRTHSSYQVHPYLFKFIEASNYQYSIENAFYNRINQELEDSKTFQKLGDIIGEFGQVINIAMKNQYDFSGYKTRYEMSTHESDIGSRGIKYTTIDYDGAFYPDAVNEFISNPDEVINQLSNMQGDFYRKYYYPLNLTQNQLNYICEQLSEHKDRIIEKAKNKTNKKDVWDIYKYARDAYDNAYILYKKYDKENPSIKEKKDTRGELWIRMKDHPIALPAFNGTYPQIDTRADYYNNLLDNILSGESKIGSVENDEIQYFYDMELDSTKQVLFMPYYPVYVMSELSSNPDAYDNYDSASIIACQITQEYIQDERLTKIQLNSNRADTGKIDGFKNLGLAKLGQDGFTLNNIFNDNTQTRAVFINKKYVEDQNSSYHYELTSETQVGVKIVTFNRMNSMWYTENQTIPTEESSTILFTNPDIKTAQYDGLIVFVAPVSTPEDNTFRTYIGKADESEPGDEYGRVQMSDSESTSAYNSYTNLQEHIGIIETYLQGTTLKLEKTNLYNINAAPSYIPTFPGLSGQIDISKSTIYNQKFDENRYLNFQLLGKSNVNMASSIDDKEANIDSDILASPDAYREIIYGRVWEDYNISDENNFNIVYNNTIYSNRGTNINYKINELSDVNKYPDKDLSAIEIGILNEHTYGKNAYFTGLLTQISTDSSTEFFDLDYMVDVEDAEVSSTGNEDIRIAGTYSAFDNKVNHTENNHINGIAKIQAQFYKRQLTVRFVKENEDDRIMIPYETIHCFILNPNNITVFEKYHIMDQYAVLNGIIDETGDHRTYQDGDRTINMSSEHLSAYSSLSSVPYLSGFNQMSFKYDESLVFPEKSIFYYYPTYNDKYPFSTVDVFRALNHSLSTNAYVNLSNIFSQEDTFIVKCDDEDIIENIQEIQIPITNADSNAIIVYEDYDGIRDQIDTVDVKILSCMNVVIADGSDSKSISINQTDNYDDFVNAVNELSDTFQIIKVEDSIINQDNTTEFVTLDTDTLSSVTEQLRKFMNINMNFDKTDEGIVLYFNYINYLNTPYIKINDSKIRMDIIDRTYLRLQPGEDGRLDIVVQLKYYSGGSLYGYKNMKLCTYHIWNLSDSSPKMLISKESQLNG